MLLRRVSVLQASQDKADRNITSLSQGSADREDIIKSRLVSLEGLTATEAQQLKSRCLQCMPFCAGLYFVLASGGRGPIPTIAWALMEALPQDCGHLQCRNELIQQSLHIHGQEMTPANFMKTWCHCLWYCLVTLVLHKRCRDVTYSIAGCCRLKALEERPPSHLPLLERLSALEERTRKVLHPQHVVGEGYTTDGRPPLSRWSYRPASRGSAFLRLHVVQGSGDVS